MAKKKMNQGLILVLIVAALIIFGKGDTFTFKGAIGDVSNAIITRTVPVNVKAGSSFDVGYIASGIGAGSWGVLVEDDVTSGGCTPSAIDVGWVSPSLTYNMPMTAPSSAGSCVFGGTYIFGGEIDKPIQIDNSDTVNICIDECSVGEKGCVDIDTGWTCDVSGVCGIQASSDCNVGYDCSSGVCVANCDSLKSTALSSIVAWSGNPTSSNKQAALNAIVAWATEC